MAKKKSKTQKAKINAKRKLKKDLSKETVRNSTQKQEPQKVENKKRLVKQDKIIYNVAITKPDIIEKTKKSNKPQNKNTKKTSSQKTNNTVKTSKSKLVPKPNLKSDLTNKHPKQKKYQNIISKLFSGFLIATFIILLIGLIKVNDFKTSTIIYISVIAIFLIAIAVSYNKYTSGKVFTIFLCLTMSFFIYRLNYSYDFFKSLNFNKYENKTYYIVTFDNNTNKTIYNINGKKIGLLNENKKNIERKLDTKLDNITYLEYTDINLLYEDFYNQQFRALIVNENQYKYLKNNNNENKKNIKILYEFQVNALK